MISPVPLSALPQHGSASEYMRRSFQIALQLAALMGVLLLFFVSLELLERSFHLMGEGAARTLVRTTANPFVGLFIGILATSLVQSSSTITSLTVSIVAGGGFGSFPVAIAHAVPIMMGANIGTSVTNTIVALGSVTRPDEFERAVAGATVHDFFNLLTVLVFFPLELGFGLLSRLGAALTDVLAGLGGVQLLSPVLDGLTVPLATGIVRLAQGSGVVVLVAGLALVFVSIRFLVRLLRVLVLGRSERLLHRFIFGPAPRAVGFGLLITFLVQSSSITTALTVPLVGAGLVSVAQIFPFVVGANLGTTMTALVAALAVSGGQEAGEAALTVALAHFAFNALGVLLFLPIECLRRIPIRLAETMGRLVRRNRLWALAYLVAVFFLVPLLAVALNDWFAA